MVWLSVLLGIAFVVLGPVVGCLVTGVDRILTARMQGRQGPPVLQPYYDLRKLLEKDFGANDRVQLGLMALSLVMLVTAGTCFFAGANFLLCVLLETLSSLLYVVAASIGPSPFVQVGVQREILQVMCYEPMLLLVGVSIYLATGSFASGATLSLGAPLVVWMPLVFIGLLFVLTIKLRKSPFDVASGAHAHQEIIAGASTEMSGATLAVTEVAHWYDTVLALGWVGMFFITCSPLSALLAIAAIAVVYLLEIWVDNTFARVKWQAMLKSSWLVALVACLANFALYYFIGTGGVLFL